MKNQSPFLDISSFVKEDEPSDLIKQEVYFVSESPFLSIYEMEQDGGMTDPSAEELIVFLHELYDDEFSDVLANMAYEARSIIQNKNNYEWEHNSLGNHSKDQLLQQHFMPLINEVDHMLDFLSREFQQRETYGLTEDAVEEIFQGFTTSIDLTPNFQDFLGKLKKKIKKVAKKAVSVAKKGAVALATGGISLILPKLKPLIKPLLDRVIQFAIGKLPSNLQPLAKKLADKLPLLKEFEYENGIDYQRVVSGIEGTQHEFNYQLANIVFSSSEVELELELSHFISETQPDDNDPMYELDSARIRFNSQLLKMREGEDPTPYVEDFIPAILPALKMGINLIGRKRVVDFLANLLGKLIQKFVGRQYTVPLSRAIVDAGLKLIQLEADEEPGAPATRAVVATIEETINKVGAAPDYILDNKELLDAYVIEAFEQSAAVNFPPVLSPGIYRKRPDLGIGRKFNGVWAMMPAGAKKRFKKFSRKIPVKLSPSRLASIRTFKGVGMDEYLEEVYQLDPGEDTEAFLHLYEAIEGTQLYDIAEIEHLPGKGTTSEGLMPLHPFTREAATMFLGEADMGNDASDMYPVQPGQRYYYLEIAGKRPMMRSAANGQLKSHRPGCAWLVLDFPKNQIQLFNFISESRAQEIAVKLRKKGNEGNLSIRFKKTIERHLEKLFSGKSGNIKIIHEAIRPGAWSDALKRIPQFLIQSFQEKLLEWTVKAFAGYLKNQAEEFCKATEDNADGVTVSISIINPPGLTQLRQVIKGKLNHGASIFLQGVLPEIKIKVEAGYSHE